MHVAILMATFNGAAFLEAQLDSILSQQHTDWSLHISDDGSSDETHAIAKRFQSKCAAGQVFVRTRPRRGFAENFLSMIKEVPLGAAMVFCDQDDVWLSHRLDAALKLCAPGNCPSMVLLRRDICNVQGKRLRTESHHLIDGFQHALFRNPIRGNACLFSPKAVNILRGAALPPAGMVPFHDWYSGLLLIGSGVQILRSDIVGLRYRQHDANTFNGQNRVRLGLSGAYRSWIWQNIRALSESNLTFTASNTRTLRRLNEAQQTIGLQRAEMLHRAGVPISKAMLGLGGWV